MTTQSDERISPMIPDDLRTELTAPPKLPPLRVFVVKRLAPFDDVTVEAHAFDMVTTGVLLFYEFVYTNQQLVQYKRYAFKEWMSVEKVVLKVPAVMH